MLIQFGHFARRSSSGWIVIVGSAATTSAEAINSATATHASDEKVRNQGSGGRRARSPPRHRCPRRQRSTTQNPARRRMHRPERWKRRGARARGGASPGWTRSPARRAPRSPVRAGKQCRARTRRRADPRRHPPRRPLRLRPRCPPCPQHVVPHARDRADRPQHGDGGDRYEGEQCHTLTRTPRLHRLEQRLERFAAGGIRAHCSAPMSIARVAAVVVNRSVRMRPKTRAIPAVMAIQTLRPVESPSEVMRRAHCTALPMLNGRIRA